MSTINKLKAPCSVLQGLSFNSLLYNIKDNKTTIYCETIVTNLDEAFEHDRVFNDVDLLEDMNIGDMESPHEVIKTKVIINDIKPTTIHKDKIKLGNKYNDKVKG